MLEGRASGTPWGDPRGAAKYPTIHKIARLQQRVIQTQNVRCAEVDKSWPTLLKHLVLAQIQKEKIL